MSAAEQMADELYGLHCDIGRLERENDKLRAERDEWHRVAESKQDIIDHMRDDRAKNDKLRKLVAKMARALGVNSEWCERDCAREFDCHDMDECPIEVSMKELGVEV